MKTTGYERLDHHLQDCTLSIWVKVGEFNTLSLLAQPKLFEIGRYKWGSLIGVLERDILGDGAALKKNEAVVILISQRTVISCSSGKRV